MNPDKQRIAIAEACGWENSQTDSKTCYNPHGAHCYWSDVPDYLNDLNACHEMEKVLPAEERGQYVCWLNYVLMQTPFSEKEVGYEDCWPEVTATAAQRAEAFLRTIGKWEEDK